MPEETPRTEVRATAKYVRTAPRKAQLVAEQIRGRSVPEARTILTFMTRDAARDVGRVFASAVANAETNHGLDGDDLYVATATVGAGPTLKRWRARARGRVGRIKKRTCHITITLALPGEQPIPAPVKAVPAQPVAAEEPSAPEKARRAPRKKVEPEAHAAVAPVEVAPAEAPAEEKPKRAPRKTAAAEALPGEALAGEKPKRASRKKAEAADETPGEVEKPARRKKKESEES
jgi:large subunit ribosomal protein L22